MHAVKDAFEEGTPLRLCYFWEAAMNMVTVKVTGGIPRSAEGGAIGQAVGGVVEATSDRDSNDGDRDNETLAHAAASGVHPVVPANSGQISVRDVHQAHDSRN
jgi:hypothetical protein